MKLPNNNQKDLKELSEQNIRNKIGIFMYYTKTIELLANEIMKDEVIQYAGEK